VIDQIQTSDAPGGGLGALRKKALRRSKFCPGAGFAFLGCKVLAIISLLASLCVLMSIVWVSFFPSSESLWALIGFFILFSALSIGERVAVRRVTPHQPGPRFLVGGFPFAASLWWVGIVAVLVVFLGSFGSVRVLGPGMSPTFEVGEQVLYHRRALDERLLRGKVIAYKLSGQSAWGQPGWLVVSRILAVPGDQLSIQNDRYFVNGEPGPVVAVTGEYAPIITVPQTPDTIQVPENCYFIVQDSPKGGFDSRVLSWAHRKDIVSTDLYYLRARGILKEIK